MIRIHTFNIQMLHAESQQIFQQQFSVGMRAPESSGSPRPNNHENISPQHVATGALQQECKQNGRACGRVRPFQYLCPALEKSAIDIGRGKTSPCLPAWQRCRSCHSASTAVGDPCSHSSEAQQLLPRCFPASNIRRYRSFPSNPVRQPVMWHGTAGH
eukprot:SAG31_NODE_6610_length_1953_cov_1.699569_2_plen_158_part_00